jgi:hypothetical protein
MKEKAEKILKYKRPYNRKSSYMECKNKSDTTNNKSNWNHLKITQNEVQ